jgi:hypothetical protein
MCHFKDLRTISKKKTYLVKMMSNTIKTFNVLNIKDLNISASIPRYSPRNLKQIMCVFKKFTKIEIENP